MSVSVCQSFIPLSHFHFSSVYVCLTQCLFVCDVCWLSAKLPSCLLISSDLSVCSSVWLSVYVFLPIRPSVCLSVCRLVYGVNCLAFRRSVIPNHVIRHILSMCQRCYDLSCQHVCPDVCLSPIISYCLFRFMWFYTFRINKNQHQIVYTTYHFYIVTITYY